VKGVGCRVVLGCRVLGCRVVVRFGVQGAGKGVGWWLGVGCGVVGCRVVGEGGRTVTPPNSLGRGKEECSMQQRHQKDQEGNGEWFGAGCRA